MRAGGGRAQAVRLDPSMGDIPLDAGIEPRRKVVEQRVDQQGSQVLDQEYSRPADLRAEVFEDNRGCCLIDVQSIT